MKVITFSFSDMAASGGSKPRTRHSSDCKMSSYAGSPQDFSPADVPTLRAVIRRGLLLKEEMKEGGIDPRHYSARAIAHDLAPIVEAQWQKANVNFVFPVIVSRQRIVEKIFTLWTKVYDVAYGRGKAKERAKVDESMEKLLDIVFCTHPIHLCSDPMSKCSKLKKCKVKAHALCTCLKEEKVPVLELQWLHSQRLKVGEKGGMQMGSGDVKFTKKHNKFVQNKADLFEAEKKRDNKIQKENDELLDRQSIIEEEEIETDLVQENIDAEEVFQPPALARKEEQEVKELVTCLLRERLGRLGTISYQISSYFQNKTKLHASS